MPQIELRNISKSFQEVQALQNFNLKIENGEYFCLLGPTGHGKTTLLYVLAGICKPNKGEVLFDGEIVTNMLPEFRRVGFVWEGHNLFPHMNVLGNVIYGRRVKGRNLKEAREVAEGILDMVLLTGRNEAIPSELSGGMRQRVGVARALAAEPQILLMDEPYGALDAKIRMELREEVRNLVKELGLTCIHATHDTEEAFMVADRVAVMHHGEAVQIDPPELIYRNPHNKFVAQFVSEANVLNVNIDEVEDNFAWCFLTNKRLKAKNSGLLRGDKGHLIIKSENLIPKKYNPDMNKVLSGMVERVKFVGQFYRFTIRLTDGQKVICRALPGQVERFAPNEQVHIEFTSELSFVYPIDEQGFNIENKEKNSTLASLRSKKRRNIV